MERAFTEDLKQQGINDTKQTGKRKDTLDIRDIELTVANHAENAVTARSAQYDQDLAIIQETLDTLLVKQQTLEDLDGYVPELEEEVSVHRLSGNIISPDFATNRGLRPDNGLRKLKTGVTTLGLYSQSSPFCFCRHLLWRAFLE